MNNRLFLKNGLSLLFLLLLASMLLGCGESEQRNGRAQVGKPAPVFDLPDLQGKNWNLQDLKGKVVLLNFWASWCAPCLEEMPSMVSLDNKMPPEYFKMVTILYNDRPDYAQSVINKAKASFPVLLDPDAEMAMAYGLTGVPETFIIDPQGILREKIIGPRDWSSEDAIGMLEHYFPDTYRKIVR